MLTVSPDPQSSERSQTWLKSAFLDEPEVRSLNAFICELTSTRELHDALRLISEAVRGLLKARFVAVVVFEDESQQVADEPAEAAVVVSLRVAGSTIGQITAYVDQPRALTAAETQALGLIAAVAAVTLDNAKRLQRERKRLAQAEALNNLAPRIAVAQTREELARLVVAALKNRMHYDAVRVLWRDGEGEEVICLAATRGPGNDSAVEQAWQDSGAAVRALREGQSLLIGDQGDWRELVGTGGMPGLRSLLAVPVRGGRGVLGVLEVGARGPRAFDNSDLVALTSLAAQVAAVGERLGARLAEDQRPASELDRARGELLAQVVHDLRGPLSVIKGYAATLLRINECPENKEKRRRFTSGIDEAADRMTMILDHVAGVSRLESGRVQFKLRQVDLTQLATEAVERLRPQLGEHPISLELPGEVLHVHADGEQISRAVGHLLLNAARQSPANGRISVRVSGQSSVVKALSPGAAPESRVVALGQGYGVVEVSDDGPGIPREQLGKAFEKFLQLPGHGGQKKGSGLELYVARKIVEAHGGRVWAESEIGHGCTLCFGLPLSVLDR